MSAPQLRPLGIGEILDVGMKIAWRNAGTLIRAVVLVVLPVQILSTIILLSSIPDGYEYDASEFGTSGPDPGVDISNGEAATFATGVGISLLLPWLAGLLATGACFRAIVSAYLGESTGWRESLGYALRRAHSILWVTLLVGVISILGLLLCIVPGVYLYVCFAVAIPVLLTEGAKGTKALGRSRRLVSGTWWRVLAIVVLSGILVGIIGFAIGGIAAGVTTVGAGSSAITIGLQQIVTGTVSSVLTTPLTAAFTTILYFDLRVRKEGFDLWLLAERLGVEPPEGYVAPAPQPQPGGLWAPGSEQPPYWPPPPGWQPSGSGGPQPPAPAPPSAPAGEEQPPFWPPPPGWKPAGSAPPEPETPPWTPSPETPPAEPPPVWPPPPRDPDEPDPPPFTRSSPTSEPLPSQWPTPAPDPPADDPEPEEQPPPPEPKPGSDRE